MRDVGLVCVTQAKRFEEGKDSMQVQIENITIDTVELRKLISSLDDAIARNRRVRALCEKILALQTKTASTTSRKSPRTGMAHRKGARGRRRRGTKTLATVIEEVLKNRKKPLRPAELRDRVLAAGYETRAKPESFYVAVFNTAKKIPGVLKTKEGFRLGG